MRVIAGNYKGRQLKAVPGMKTRPTSDKIKEAVFHRIGPFFEEGACLDLFAGSGALGLEALSRGMDKVTFVDSSTQAVKIIRYHIKLLEAQAICEVYQNDAHRAVDVLAKKGAQFKLILLDPPYDETLYQSLVDSVMKAGILQKDGFLYVEHRPETIITVQEDVAEVIFSKRYNRTTSVTIFEKL